MNDDDFDIMYLDAEARGMSVACKHCRARLLPVTVYVSLSTLNRLAREHVCAE